MPKVTLEFNLPEEKQEFDTAVKAQHYLATIDNFQQYLRNRLKHDELTDEQYHFCERIQKKFLELLNDYE